MPNSGNVVLWKKRSEIDYIPLFISLWLSINAWMRDRFQERKDREMIESLKNGGNTLSDKFAELMHEKTSDGSRFRGNFAELHRALKDALIPHYKCATKYLVFDDCVLNWNNGELDFESILKEKGQRNKIKIDDNLWIDDNNERLFSAYIEIIYQIRCALFHGQLAPVKENERVFKQIYLTLSMIMDAV